MKKRRFRDIKKGKIDKKDDEVKIKFASIRDRLKAGITDSFMLLMPIMYIVFYLVMGSREAFAEDRLMGWIYIIIPFIIVQSLFLYFGDGQTPGYKSYDLKVIDINTNQRPTIYQILLRSILTLTSITILPILYMLIRKDKRAIYDVITNTGVIKINS